MICQLYRHYDKDERLLYVGISINAINRLSQHREASLWFRDIANVKIEAFPDRDSALQAERKAIVAEQPLHNIHHKNGRAFEDGKAQIPVAERLDEELGREERTGLVRQVALKPVYSLLEAANILGIGTRTLRELIDAGKIRHFSITKPGTHRWRGVEYENKPKEYISGWHIMDYLESIGAVT